MKITKYEHACVVLERDGNRLIIDPGTLTASLPLLDHVVGVVATHVHPDHLSTELIKDIVARNPDAKLYTTHEAVKETGIIATPVGAGDVITLPGFELAFTGGAHAAIDVSKPQFENVGLIANGSFYYPGDALEVLDRELQVIAVPAVAPWAKVSESMDFIRASRVSTLFPTHNGLLSVAGHEIYNHLLRSAAQERGAAYVYLEPGESLEVTT